MNKTIISTGATAFIHSASVSSVRIQREGTSSTFTFNNTSGDSYTRGIQVGTSRMCIYFPLVFNNCQRALSIHDASHVYLHSATGTASEFGIFANYGSMVGYSSFSVTAPTVTKADTGARIYTGSQS